MAEPLPDPVVDGEFHLVEGEKLYKVITPHYMAFYDMYLIWLAVILITVFFLFFGEQVSEFLANPGRIITGMLVGFGSGSDVITDNVPVLSAFKAVVYGFSSPIHESFMDYAQIPSWIFCLFLLSMSVSVIKIQFKWAALIPGTAILSTLAVLYFGWDPRNAYLLSIGFAIVGMFFVELYRRAHKFYLTDSRIVTQVSFISNKRNELEYEMINNLVLEQDLIGRLFDFGVLIPITASGLGMGQDHAFVALGAGGASPLGGGVGVGVMGGRTINTPRARSMYSLFGIPDPVKVQDMISHLMRQDNEAPILREMTGILKDIRDSKPEDGSSKTVKTIKINEKPPRENSPPSSGYDP